LKLDKTLLKTYPSITFHKELVDAHFYIFAKWVLDVLEKYEKDISSIKGELLPFLVKLQLRKKLKKGGIPESVFHSETLAAQMSASHDSNKDGLGCFAYVMEEGFCARVNTIHNFLELNHEVAKGNTSYMPWEKPGKGNFIADSADVNPKTQVGSECIVGEGTKIGEKCSVKKSNIGKHCNIGSNVKIANSVIMDHVTIMDKCTIHNSIVSNSVHMAENSSIKDCQVGVSFNFEPNSDFKNESLVSVDE